MPQYGAKTAINLTTITDNSPLSAINNNFRKIQAELANVQNLLGPKADAGKDAYDFLNRYLGTNPPASKSYADKKIEEAKQELDAAEERISQAEQELAEAEQTIAEAEQRINELNYELAKQRDYLENFSIEVSDKAYQDALDRVFEWSFTSQQNEAIFIRNSTAQLPDGTVVGVNEPRYVHVKKYL